jgi:UTP--glucose-1-phosphate uridylyltransferase
MGAAISLFPRSAAVRIPRHRFSPVKNTNDLLAVRSDAYRLTDTGHIILDPARERPPTISLDERHYKLIDAFDRRFPAGPPSLQRCDSLTVEGDATFAAGIAVRGAALVRAAAPATVASGTVIEGLLEV